MGTEVIQVLTIVISVLVTVGTATWILSGRISSLTSSDTNMKDDIAELRKDVGTLKTDVAEIKGQLEPVDRISITPSPRKKVRR